MVKQAMLTDVKASISTPVFPELLIEDVIFKEDIFLIESLEEQGKRFGLNGAEIFETSRYLVGGDEVTVGDQTFGVRHCPGHTPGHIIFFHKEASLAAVGDVIFLGSIGRSDLPRGNHEQLVQSIINELWPLGDEMTFIPGHGQLSTFGQERMTNPYVSDFALGVDRDINEKIKNYLFLLGLLFSPLQEWSRLCRGALGCRIGRILPWIGTRGCSLTSL